MCPAGTPIGPGLQSGYYYKNHRELEREVVVQLNERCEDGVGRRFREPGIGDVRFLEPIRYEYETNIAVLTLSLWGDRATEAAGAGASARHFNAAIDRCWGCGNRVTDQADHVRRAAHAKRLAARSVPHYDQEITCA